MQCFFQSLNDSYVADAYDELLTQAEIQGHINYVNGKYKINLANYIKMVPELVYYCDEYISAFCALEVIVSSVSRNNTELISALRISALPFKV